MLNVRRQLLTGMPFDRHDRRRRLPSTPDEGPPPCRVRPPLSVSPDSGVALPWSPLPRSRRAGSPTCSAAWEPASRSPPTGYSPWPATDPGSPRHPPMPCGVSLGAQRVQKRIGPAACDPELRGGPGTGQAGRYVGEGPYHRGWRMLGRVELSKSACHDPAVLAITPPPRRTSGRRDAALEDPEPVRQRGGHQGDTRQRRNDAAVPTEQRAHLPATPLRG